MAIAMGKLAVTTVEMTEATVEVHGPNGAEYTVTIFSGGIPVPGKTKTGNLDGSGAASVKFTLPVGSFTSRTNFSGKENTTISEDFTVS